MPYNSEYTRKTPEERRKEIDDKTAEMQKQVVDLIHSGKIQQILDGMSKFHSYSWRNTMMILGQKPDASIVAGYRLWRDKFNRQVKRGEHGLAILVPMKYQYTDKVDVIDPKTNLVKLDRNGDPVKEERKVDALTFKIGYVFDISQTEQIPGREVIPLSAASPLTGEIGDKYPILFQAVKDSASPVPITFEVPESMGEANGYYDFINKRIAVKDDMSEEQTIKTSIHETAHSLLHNMESDANVAYYVTDQKGHIIANNLTAKSAAKEYEAETGRSIGIRLNDGSKFTGGTAVKEGHICYDNFNQTDHYRYSLPVQKALFDLEQYFPSDGINIHESREIQAEGTAYTVCARYGINTSDYSIGYVTEWAHMNADEVLKNLNAIAACSDTIIERMDKSIEQQQSQIDEKKLADQVNHFLMTTDPEGYKEKEIYAGSNYNDIYTAIRNGNTADIKSRLTNCKDTMNAKTADQLIEQLTKHTKREEAKNNHIEMKSSGGMSR